MKYSLAWDRLEVDTIRGEAIMVSLVYSSFDKSEIDKLEEELRSRYGDWIAAGEINKEDKNEE